MNRREFFKAAAGFAAVGALAPRAAEAHAARPKPNNNPIWLMTSAFAADRTFADVVKRAGEFLEAIRGLEGDVLISTHAIAMKGLLEYLTPDSNGSYWSRFIGNCAVYTVDNREGAYGLPAALE